MQGEICEKQERQCNLWLEQNDLAPNKTAAVKSSYWRNIVRSNWLEQLVETMSECSKCRLCGDKKETVEFSG